MIEEKNKKLRKKNIKILKLELEFEYNRLV